MKLSDLLVGIENLKARGNLDKDIKKVVCNSNNVEAGDLFVAIKGFEEDGHEFVNDAIKKGAVAVLVEEGCNYKSFKVKSDTVVVMAKNTREALAIVSCNYYKNPSKKLKLIGITGTKGKTTTSYMIKEILEKAGKKVGLIGTLETVINGKKIKENDRTTPESLELQEMLGKMVKEKVEIAVIEVSSQSLKLHRVTGCNFDIVIFTNFSKDHISKIEHPTMEDYLQSKLKLFEMCNVGIVNNDDVQGAKIPRLFPNSSITTFGIDNHADVMARDVTVTNTYADFKVKLTDKNERVKVGIPGRFSIYNALVAICVAKRFEISPDIIKEALLEVRVPGRSEMIDNKAEIPIMIDYAHTPESLESILKTVKIYTKGRVILVFGCGGNRDKTKRPIMGEIAGRVADYTFITTDNSRDEEPEEIANQIEEGIKKTKGKYSIELDRKEAIKEAIKMSSKADIVVIAGKGHEMYQEIKGKKNPFDERKIVREIIDEIK